MVGTYDFDTCGQRLLAENVLVGFNRLDCLLGVNSGRGCNHDSLQTLMLQHIVVVLVQRHAKWNQVCLGPFELSGIWRTGGDEFSARSALQEVQGVTLAHAAETGAADLHSLGGHVGDCMKEEIKQDSYKSLYK